MKIVLAFLFLINFTFAQTVGGGGGGDNNIAVISVKVFEELIKKLNPPEPVETTSQYQDLDKNVIALAKSMKLNCGYKKESKNILNLTSSLLMLAYVDGDSSNNIIVGVDYKTCKCSQLAKCFEDGNTQKYLKKIVSDPNFEKYLNERNKLPKGSTSDFIKHFLTIMSERDF